MAIALFAPGCGDDDPVGGADSAAGSAATEGTGSTATSGDSDSKAGNGEKSDGDTGGDAGGADSQADDGTSTKRTFSNPSGAETKTRLSAADRKSIGRLLGEAEGATLKYITYPSRHGWFDDDSPRKPSAVKDAHAAAEFVIANMVEASSLVGLDAKFAELRSQLTVTAATFKGVKLSVKNSLQGPGTITPREMLEKAIRLAEGHSITVKTITPSRSEL